MLGKLSIFGGQKSPEEQQQVKRNYERTKVIVDRRAMARARLSEANTTRSTRARDLRKNLVSEGAPDIATALSGLPAALSGITTAVPGLGLPAIPKRPIGGLISWAVSKLVSSVKGAISSVIRGFRMRRPFLFYGILIFLVLLILYPVLGTLGILFGLIGIILDTIASIASFVFGFFSSAAE